jgi:type IV pilus assembly protein PilM
MHTLGLHVDGDTLRVALLRRHNKTIEIELLRSFPLADVKPLYMLESVLAEKKVDLVTGLDASEVLLRQIDFKLRMKRQILAVLPFQVETLIPYPLEEAILLPFFKRKDQETSVTLLSTTQNHLKRHLEFINTLEVDPDFVSCAPAALFRTARFLYPEHPSLYLLHFGTHKSLFAVMVDGALALSHTLNMGSQSLLENPQAFQNELDRQLAFAKKKLPKLPEAFLLTGQTNPQRKELTFAHTVLESETDLSYALPIGLALDGLLRDPQTVQFRKGAFVPPLHVKKRLKQLGMAVSLCLAAALFTWTCGHFVLASRKAGLHAALQQNGRDQENLEDALFEWEEALASKKHSFPYFPTVPKVSDALAWLSTHPQLIAEEEKEKIEIKNFRYLLTKYPKIGEKTEPYQAKVELEFTATSPRLARAFHDALMRGDRLVNAKQEITWKAHQNTYQTSFFLRKP